MRHQFPLQTWAHLLPPAPLQLLHEAKGHRNFVLHIVGTHIGLANNKFAHNKTQLDQSFELQLFVVWKCTWMIADLAFLNDWPFSDPNHRNTYSQCTNNNEKPCLFCLAEKKKQFQRNQTFMLRSLLMPSWYSSKSREDSWHQNWKPQGAWPPLPTWGPWWVFSYVILVKTSHESPTEDLSTAQVWVFPWQASDVWGLLSCVHSGSLCQAAKKRNIIRNQKNRSFSTKSRTQTGPLKTTM